MKRGFVPLVIVIIIAAAAVIGGGAVIAWRTTYLDPILPSTVREFLRRGGAVPSSESSAETPSETPESEDPTKDWKTYTNEELGVSFRYPESWQFADLGDGWLVFGPRAGEFDPDRPRPQLEFGGFSGDYGYNIGLAPEDEVWLIEEKSTEVGGETAVRTEHTHKKEGQILIARVRFPKFPEIIIGFYPLNGDLSTFDFILSGFKFTGT